MLWSKTSHINQVVPPYKSTLFLYDNYQKKYLLATVMNLKAFFGFGKKWKKDIEIISIQINFEKITF